jgi:hypothetical protein
MLTFPNRTHTGRGARLVQSDVSDEYGMTIAGKSYLGHEIRLPLEQCVGVNFEIRMNNLSEVVEGSMMVVSRSDHRWEDFWPWFILLDLYLFLGWVVARNAGPLSALLVVAAFLAANVHRQSVPPLFVWTCLLAVTWIHLYLGVGSLCLVIFLRQCSNSHAFGKNGWKISSLLAVPNSPPLLPLPTAAYLVTFGERRDEAITSTPRMTYQSFHAHSTLYVPELLLGDQATDMVAGRRRVSVDEFRESQPDRPTISMIQSVTAVSKTAWSLPDVWLKIPKRAQMPYVFEFAQDEIGQMIELRKTIIRELQLSMPLPWLSNRYTEYVMSLILPDFIYNHIGLRQFLQIVSDFLIPIFAIAQGFAILFPWMKTNLMLLYKLLEMDLVSRLFVEFVVPTFYPDRLITFLSDSLSAAASAIVDILRANWFIDVASVADFLICRLASLQYLIVYVASRFNWRLVGSVLEVAIKLLEMIFHPVIRGVAFLSKLFTFGRRTPENIILLTKRVTETCKVVWDRCRHITIGTKHTRSKEV